MSTLKVNEIVNVIESGGPDFPMGFQVVGDQISDISQILAPKYAATKSAGDTLASSLPDGATVIVTADESQGGVRVRYTVASGVLTSPVPDTAAGVQFTQSGTGAVPRTAQDKMRETVSVKDFGAVGDGVTDDTSAIQLAISVGRNIIIPKGTYLIDALVGISIVGGKQHIMLEKGAVLQAKPNNSALVYQVIKILDVADVLVTGGTIIGDRATHTGVTGESGMGIYVVNSENITIRDVEIRDCWGDGIYVGGTGTTGKSVNVRVENCVCTNNRRQGLTIAAVDGCIVDGGKFTNSNGTAPESGIDIEPNPGKGSVNNVVVRNVLCEGNNGHGIAVSQTICTNVKLSKNTVTNNGINGIQSAYIGSDLLISGNTVTDNAENGILIQGDNAYVTREIVISDNTVNGNGETGIKFLNNIRRFTVKGNTVYGNGFNGMSFEGGASVCDDGVVAGNNCESNSQAAHNTYANILIGSLAHFTRFSNNVCRKGTLANKPAYGIRATNNEANWVTDNDLYTGGETANFNGVLSNLTIQRNIGFRTENHVLSNTFLVDAVATVTVTIAHGCAYTPSTHHCQLTIVDPNAADFSVGSIKIQSVDATNVTARVKITSAASTGNTARLALSVRRPSPL